MQPLDDLLHHLQRLRKPLILGHESADPDAVASALGLNFLIGGKIAFPSLSREGKVLIEHSGLPYELMPRVDGYDVVVVDTNQREMLGGIDLSRARSVTVVDHHTTPATIEGTLFIYPDYTSTSEVVARLILQARQEIPHKLREILLAGILFDTKSLYLAKKETLSLVSKLLPQGRTVADIHSLFYSPKDISERIARLKALRKGRIIRYGDYLLVVTDAGSFEASVANVIVSAGADAAIAYGKEKKIGRVSLRASPRFLKEIGPLTAFVENNEECGGHEGAVGCHCDPEVCENLVERIKERILKKLKGKLGPQVLREY